MSEKHVMIDIETMGNGPTSAILSIGAVHFNPRERMHGDAIPEFISEFEVNVSLEDCMSRGLTVDGSTIKWWLQQSAGARLAILEGSHLPSALARLVKWMTTISKHADPDVRIWARPPSFDVVILENAFYVAGISIPWDFRSPRCVRTVLELAHLDPRDVARDDKTEIAHTALADARHQARCVQYAYARLNG